MYDLKMNVHDWDNFIPFEKQIYLDLLNNRLEKEIQNKQQGPDINWPTKEDFEPHGQGGPDFS